MSMLIDSKNHQKGQGLVEYALILVLVAVVVLAVLLILGPNIGNMFTKINSSLPAEGAGQAPTVATEPTAVPVWTTCANEHGFCSFTGTHPVKYGAGSSWYTGTFTNGVACNNSVFGDPLVGTVKSCQVYK
jgi:Flp pilus assembly pilin Flp